MAWDTLGVMQHTNNCSPVIHKLPTVEHLLQPLYSRFPNSISIPPVSHSPGPYPDPVSYVFPMKTIVTDSPEEAASFILSGETAAFPTETVYGLGADAFNANGGSEGIRGQGAACGQSAYCTHRGYRRSGSGCRLLVEDRSAPRRTLLSRGRSPLCSPNMKTCLRWSLRASIRSLCACRSMRWPKRFCEHVPVPWRRHRPIVRDGQALPPGRPYWKTSTGGFPVCCGANRRLSAWNRRLSTVRRIFLAYYGPGA